MLSGTKRTDYYWSYMSKCGNGAWISIRQDELDSDPYVVVSHKVGHDGATGSIRYAFDDFDQAAEYFQRVVQVIAPTIH
jgi:hypothetical protein